MVELKIAYEQITKFLPSHDREMVDKTKFDPKTGQESAGWDFIF